jgi:hypothetical protein
MVRRKVGPVLAEMLDAIKGIETHTAGKSLSDFEHKWLLKLAQSGNNCHQLVAVVQRFGLNPHVSSSLVASAVRVGREML